MDLPFKLIKTNEVEKWRADTFWTKEPETLEWIRSFDDSGCFWDVGANIGIYSLYAASLNSTRAICAFEPSILNINRLKQNYTYNDFRNIRAYRFALSNEQAMGKFIDKEVYAGGANGQLVVLPYSGDLAITTIDTLIINMDMTRPAYIKIDVDGVEFNIIEGAIWTISHDWCKSILIEIDPTCTNVPLLDKIMHQHGFTTNNVFNQMDNHSRYRRMQENIIVENVVYTKG